jgi:hypothetical protein
MIRTMVLAVTSWRICLRVSDGSRDGNDLHSAGRCGRDDLMVRIVVGDQDVCSGQRSDVDQVGATKIDVVRGDDQPVGGGSPLVPPRFLPVIAGEAAFRIDPGDARYEGAATIGIVEGIFIRVTCPATAHCNPLCRLSIRSRSGARRS